MTIKQFLTLLVFAFCSCSYAASFQTLDSAQPGLYAGDPSLSKLSPSVAANTLFQPAPSPTAKQLDLASRSANDGAYYSHYQINPLHSENTRTYYQTTETVKDGGGFNPAFAGQTIVVHGQGISYGGIYWPLEKMTVTTDTGKVIYYNKIAITEMTPISGYLFPLEVGNQLKFNFTRYHERFFDGQTTKTIEHGIMEYDVISKHDHMTTKTGQAIPGTVYTLNIIETTDSHPKSYFTDQYDYAPSLGWYINDHYFDTENRPTANYLIQSWK